MASKTPDRYIPALTFRPLTRFYDPAIALTTRERAFKRRVLARAAITTGERVLDLACGTGTLAIAAAREAPGVEVTGVDGDPEVLERARGKAASAHVEVRFDEGLSTELPYPEAKFDVLVTTLFFHHLSTDAKLRSAEEARRVLRSGGRLVLADWGKPQDPLMQVAILPVRLGDGFDVTAANVAGRLPGILEQAGFQAASVTDRFRTPLGTIEVVAANAP
jgi:ubiquinone/menaquinone biosynthesis C-methylase UbiE